MGSWDKGDLRGASLEGDLSSTVAAFSAALTPSPLPPGPDPQISNQRAEGKDMEEAETQEPW